MKRFSQNIFVNFPMQSWTTVELILRFFKSAPTTADSRTNEKSDENFSHIPPSSSWLCVVKMRKVFVLKNFRQFSKALYSSRRASSSRRDPSCMWCGRKEKNGIFPQNTQKSFPTFPQWKICLYVLVSKILHHAHDSWKSHHDNFPWKIPSSFLCLLRWKKLFLLFSLLMFSVNSTSGYSPMSLMCPCSRPSISDNLWRIKLRFSTTSSSTLLIPCINFEFHHKHCKLFRIITIIIPSSHPQEVERMRRVNSGKNPL